MPELGVGIKGALYFCHGYGDTCTFFFEGMQSYSRSVMWNSPVSFVANFHLLYSGIPYMQTKF